MTPSVRKFGSALRGKTIFLSASIPDQRRSEKYNRIDNVAFEIEQAVISLARAVFSEGGRLAFGGHPAIAPLVGMVVGEYREPRFAESTEERQVAPVEIYQSRAFEGYLPDDTTLMFRLGYASLHWVDAIDGERFDPESSGQIPPCPKSLKRMREFMLAAARPDAMVCIGGMEGLEEELALALAFEQNLPIYVLERTGGAAALLRGRNLGRLRMIDTEVIAEVDRRRAGLGAADHENTPQVHRALVPYALVMQTIVEEIAHQE